MFPMLKLTMNVHTISRAVVMTTVTATIAVLSGCQTLPSEAPISDQSATQSNDSSISSALTAAMPAIDRRGYIAYVEEQGFGAAKISSLYIIRPDGSDRQLIEQLNGYIYAPAWSADGQLLAYSKQAMRERPKIYIYIRSSKTRTLVVNPNGSNLSASFSPDGQKLLYSSTVDGNADIYEIRLYDGSTTQLTTLPSTEVQPSYAADGKSFVYVSDKVRAGRPLIYRYYFATGSVTQVTTGNYAASPQLSMDGTRLAYLNGQQAAVMILTSGEVINLAETGLDEPARLSPSGNYALYPMQNAQINGQKGSSLVIRPLSGGNSYTISSKAGSVVRSPVWGH
jgi:TolB protein